MPPARADRVTRQPCEPKDDQARVKDAEARQLGDGRGHGLEAREARGAHDQGVGGEQVAGHEHFVGGAPCAQLIEANEAGRAGQDLDREQ